MNEVEVEFEELKNEENRGKKEPNKGLEEYQTWNIKCTICGKTFTTKYKYTMGLSMPV